MRVRKGWWWSIRPLISRTKKRKYCRGEKKSFWEDYLLREKKRSNYWADTGNGHKAGSSSWIEDFRRFSQISRFSTVFVHRFEHFKEAKAFRIRSFWWILRGSEQFSGENPRNFNAFCKVFPERGQKRSGHEIRVFWKALAKRGQNVIFRAFL